jgi:hypothetical protein
MIYFETFELLELFCWPAGPCATYQWHIVSIEISGFEKVKSNQIINLSVETQQAWQMAMQRNAKT